MLPDRKCKTALPPSFFGCAVMLGSPLSSVFVRRTPVHAGCQRRVGGPRKLVGRGGWAPGEGRRRRRPPHCPIDRRRPELRPPTGLCSAPLARRRPPRAPPRGAANVRSGTPRAASQSRVKRRWGPVARGARTGAGAAPRSARAVAVLPRGGVRVRLLPAGRRPAWRAETPAAAVGARARAGLAPRLRHLSLIPGLSAHCGPRVVTLDTRLHGSGPNCAGTQALGGGQRVAGVAACLCLVSSLPRHPTSPTVNPVARNNHSPTQATSAWWPYLLVPCTHPRCPAAVGPPLRFPWAATPPAPVAYLDILESPYPPCRFPSLPHFFRHEAGVLNHGARSPLLAFPLPSLAGYRCRVLVHHAPSALRHAARVPCRWPRSLAFSVGPRHEMPVAPPPTHRRRWGCATCVGAGASGGGCIWPHLAGLATDEQRRTRRCRRGLLHGRQLPTEGGECG